MCGYNDDKEILPSEEGNHLENKTLKNTGKKVYTFLVGKANVAVHCTSWTAGASLQQGAGVDREADNGLQGAVGGRREVQACEMLIFFVIWDFGRVARSL